MTTIYIVRHCKAEGQAADAPLTGIGMNQARQLVDFFLDKQVDYMVSSPFVRAYRTIAPLAESLGMDMVLDDRLQERILSGHHHPEWRDMLRRTYDEPDLCFEGGESSRAATSRIVGVVTDILAGKYANAVLVSHGNLISLLLNYYDSRFGFKEWEALSNPDVFQLTFAHGTPALTRLWKD
ncbi:histidine phosphatase family protein [Paenibacillus sp. H1-7]|uniref:histidine phosphatase family protein n=1 Tax=Paenibacillus sp. H1-7 TaxID=2282849 RepID=UPI001EF7A746|nr:histidine phosphatase family protein [Paenibacillus sp. H1-7]ULL18993.1 histidine phosphatase family protein [Paenibacillus sp. H1-7]